jgi:exopolyphosphatase/guanosine-5'-triphosphate,3'-diphosphate pyrophosphatase
MRFAAVDIGSNAVRLLFCQVSSDRNGLVIKKISLVRLPIRLGEDVFVKGSISEVNISKLSKALQAFKLLSDVYDIVDYRVCATSAMREAENSIAVVERIKKETAVKIEVVKGEEEAQLIFDTNLTEKLDKNKTYMYIDVGGGSTEITIFSNQKKLASKSFKIGTIRLKNNVVSNTLWDNMTAWMKDSKEKFNPEIAIGTGGNINTLYKLCRLDNNAILKYKQLKKISQTLKKYSIEERMERFELRPDRADVITHASNIYIEAMKTFEIKRMIVPKIGVADGVIYQLWKKSKL